MRHISACWHWPTRLNLTTLLKVSTSRQTNVARSLFAAGSRKNLSQGAQRTSRKPAEKEHRSDSTSLRNFWGFSGGPFGDHGSHEALSVSKGIPENPQKIRKEIESPQCSFSGGFVGVRGTHWDRFLSTMETLKIATCLKSSTKWRVCVN